MLIGTATKEAQVERETYPVTTKAKISNLRLYKLFCASYLLNNFGLFFQ